METRTYNVYKYNELPKESKELALEKYRYINVELDDWYDYILDEFKAIMLDYGFLDVDVMFNGFNSQGDGASFICTMDIKLFIEKQGKKDNYKTLLKDIGNGAEPYIKIIRSDHHYYHENTMYIESETGGICDEALEEFTKLESDILTVAKSKARELYKQLEQEYYDLTSDDSIIGTFEANDYDFTLKGIID